MNLTQTALAKVLGISKQIVSAYERGWKIPKIDRIIGIADTLGISVKIVFGEELSVIQSEGAYRAEILTEEAYKVACAFMEAREKDKRTAKLALDIPLE